MVRVLHRVLSVLSFTSHAHHSALDNGISFLRKGHWKDQYDLSLRLFESACKCALVIGDIVSLRLLSEQILVFARSFEDQLNSMYCTVSALCYTSQLPEAVARCTLVLSELGEPLPEAYSESEIKLYVEHTISMLQGFTSDKDLVDYKLMDDPQKLMAMKFYARLELSFLMIKPDAQPIVTMKMVQLSLARGMSPMSPLGFAYFGQLLARLGDFQSGCRYVRIGKKLLDKLGSKEVAGEVIAIGTQILSFLQPIQSTLESHVEGHNTAMAAGDVHSALLNSLAFVGMLFQSGRSLVDCRTKYSETCQLFAQHNHYVFLSQALKAANNVARLMGANDASISELSSTRNVKDNNQLVSSVQQFQEMYIHFMFREFDQMKTVAEKYFAVDSVSWSLLYCHIHYAFYGALVAFWIHRETGEPVWEERARKRKFTVETLGGHSEWNFEHKLYILDAEEASCDDPGTAELLYEKAIASARKHR